MQEGRSALCAFADWFPGVVASELEQAKSLHHQSRETSWTDRMLLARLIHRVGPRGLAGVA
ncbi:DUF6615 family protein [Novosphingobium sp. NBM11]|uniref:DUF6615 family protein n=1 Tax=Novosphingobium sp. NBM11 TaxID=2596914 RepID=UPI0035C8C3D2